MAIGGASMQFHEVTKCAVRSAGGIVAAQSRRAAMIGARVLAGGGNAVDAAVVTGLAIGALEPWMSGLGGGGFMIVAPADGSSPQAVDFGMVAPAALDPADYPLAGGAGGGLFAWPAVEDDRNIKGYGSIAVPGHVDGMRLALERFGTLSWAAALAPAITQAEAGLPLDWFATLGIAVAAAELLEFPAVRELYLPGGLPPVPPAEGESGALPLGNLARTLRRLAAAGPRDYYEGDIARALVAELQAGGSRIALDDLGAYRAIVRPALEFSYRGLAVATAPGLTAGPTLAATLDRLSRRLPCQRDLAGGPGPADYFAYAESLDEAYEERLATMGHAAPAPSCTTHLSIVDRDGMMVALTQTLLSRFGSKVLLPATGLLMNNGIMWFDPRPGGPNALAPGKRPLSNMCPTVVGRGSRPWFALGASGGRRILPAVAQVLSFLADFGMTLEEAFRQPRLDVSGDGRVTLDDRLPAEVEQAIAARLPVVRGAVSAYPVLFASPSAVLRDTAAAVNHGMADIASPWSGAVAG